jgi:hypothetical protein
MYVNGGSANSLAAIAERMAQIVDPNLRAQLTREYLALLNEYHTGRAGPDFDRRVALALSRAGFGQVSYKLTPLLGRVNDRYYRAYSDAAESLERLSRLAARQTNAALRAKWEWFLKDVGQRLTELHTEAEIASGNVHLSRMDALANETLNLLAARLMPAEVEWNGKLRQPLPEFRPRGYSGAVSRTAMPDAYEPGHAVRAHTQEELKYPYRRNRMRAQPGGGKRSGLSGILDTFQQVVTTTWETARGTAAATAGETEALFQDAVKRLGLARTRLDAQETDVKRLQLAGDAAAALAADLAERRRRWDSARAELNGIAGSMKSYSYDKLDSAQQLTRELLGQDEVAAGTVPATWLLFRGQIEGAREHVLALEKDNAAFEATLGGALSRAKLAALPRATSAALGGGVLALAAAAGALLWFSRRR